MSAYKSAVDMQFAAQEYSKICSIALYGDKAEQQISIRNTQTFLQRAISNLKPITQQLQKMFCHHWPIFLLTSMTVRMIL